MCAKFHEKLKKNCKRSSGLKKSLTTDIQTDISHPYYKLHWLQAAVELKNITEKICQQIKSAYFMSYSRGKTNYNTTSRLQMQSSMDHQSTNGSNTTSQKLRVQNSIANANHCSSTVLFWPCYVF